VVGCLNRPLDAAIVGERVAAARAAIAEAARRAGRDPAQVQLLAAVKYVSADDLPALAEAGIERVGENTAGALLAKQEVAGDLFTWDFIGHLQSRKARDVVGRVELIHSVESGSTATQIDRRSREPQSILVEVNVAGDTTKYGVAPDELDAFLERLAALERVRVRGLMTMPPFAEDAEASRPFLAALRELAAACAERWTPRHSFDVLSTGTSQDYLVAVEEGATIVRLGSVLYGPG
jgi:pyridoxal phosphate enzyme (YggS family)